VRDLNQDLAGRVRAVAAVSAEAVQGEPSPSLGALRIIDCFLDCDWTGLGTLYHPEALITTLAAAVCR
jgi:hypothetical protein